MKRTGYLFFFCLYIVAAVSASGRPVTVIPFEMAGSFIVIPVQINNSTRLRMIVDTGLRNTLITEVFQTDSVDLQPGDLRELQGLGSGKVYKAYESTGNTIKAGKVVFKDRLVYAFEEKLFNLSKQTGTRINGLLGVDFFRDYVVKVDYINKLLKLYRNSDFRPPKGFGYMPLTINRQKMFIELSVLETDSARQRIKMLIDTGAELTAWFETLRNNAVDIPEKSVHGRIGEGLSGEINGVFARVEQLCIADFCVKNPVVAFPDSVSLKGLTRSDDRDGTIGGQLLSRFHLIFDTQNRRLYFKPNSIFKLPFKYNVAGVEVARAEGSIPMIEITSVWKDSPAEKSGLKEGDVIYEINGETVFTKSVSEVRAYFETPSKRPLSVLVERDGKNIELSIDMTARI